MSLGFPGGSTGKESTCNAGDLDLIPGLGRSPGEGQGYPLQDSGLQSSMDSPWDCKESDTTERLSLSVSLCHLRGWHRPPSSCPATLLNHFALAGPGCLPPLETCGSPGGKDPDLCSQVTVKVAKAFAE